MRRPNSGFDERSAPRPGALIGGPGRRGVVAALVGFALVLAAMVVGAGPAAANEPSPPPMSHVYVCDGAAPVALGTTERPSLATVLLGPAGGGSRGARENSARFRSFSVAAEAGGGALEDAGAACGLSFAAATPVLLADGKSKPISKLAVGDKVVTVDTKEGKNRAQAVLAVLINHDTDLLDLVVVDERGHRSVVHTTAKHPIWDQTSHQWVRAANLPSGDLLRTADGQALRLLKPITPRVITGDMWDLTVATDHDFYVATGSTDVLVHNCDVPNARTYSQKALNHAISRGHGPDFGVEGQWNPAVGQQLQDAIEAHIADEGTLELPNVTFRRVAGTSYTNPETGLNAFFTPDGAFNSGYVLSPDNLAHLLEEGSYGGG